MGQIEKARARVDEILKLSDELEGLFKKGLQKAVRIGALLVEQKAETPHGSWLDWMEDNLPFSDRTAERYMDLYQHRELLVKFDTVTNFKGAYDLIHRKKHFDEMAVKYELSNEKRQQLFYLVAPAPEGEYDDYLEMDIGLKAAKPPKERPPKKPPTEFEEFVKSPAVRYTGLVRSEAEFIDHWVDGLKGKVKLDESDDDTITEKLEQAKQSIEDLAVTLDKLTFKYWDQIVGDE